MRLVFPVAGYRWRTHEGAPIIRVPVVTGNRFRAGEHEGVDIMFARLPDDDRSGDTGGEHPRYDVPSKYGPALILAPADGTVLYAKGHRNGLRVRTRHDLLGVDFVSLHLRQLLVRAGQEVRAGDPLGFLWYDPTDRERLAHDHFETRKRTHDPGMTLDAFGCIPVDPMPFLENATVIGPWFER